MHTTVHASSAVTITEVFTQVHSTSAHLEGDFSIGAVRPSSTFTVSYSKNANLSNPTSYTVTAQTSDYAGYIVMDFTGLTPGTTYYVKSTSALQYDTQYISPIKSFTTTGTAPSGTSGTTSGSSTTSTTIGTSSTGTSSTTAGITSGTTSSSGTTTSGTSSSSGSTTSPTTTTPDNTQVTPNATNNNTSPAVSNSGSPNAACKADPNEYCLLEPIPGVGNKYNKIVGPKYETKCTDPNDQSTCTDVLVNAPIYDANGNLTNPDTAVWDLPMYLNAMYKLLIGVAGVLAVLMLILGGVKYMTTESFSEKGNAKESLTNAFIGLFVVLGAWLILNMINPDLVNFNLGGVTQVKDSVDLTQKNAYEGGVDNGGNVTSSPVTTATTAAALAICYSDFKGTKDSPIDMTAVQTVVNTLNTYNTTVYNNECTTIGQSTGCTSVYGLTMDHISKIRSSCGTTCQLVITGGTECWEHDVSAAVNSGAHIPGYPVVDLEKTTTLHTYIQNNMSQKICRQGWPTKTSSLDFPMNNCASGSAVEYWIPTIGIGFVDEGDHYHTTSNQGPSGSTVETVSH